MRILVHGIHFSPEPTGIGKYSGEMAEWLAAHGHEVTVVTARPFYPGWRVEAEYRKAWYAHEIVPANSNNRLATYTVVRCPLFVPREPTGAKRLLHLGSFAISSLFAMLNALRSRPDIVLCVAPTMIVAPTSLVVARLSKAIAVLHLQDLEIDAALGLGYLSQRSLARALYKLESMLLKRFDRVSTLTTNMLGRVRAKGVSESRSFLFPNWVDSNEIWPLERPNILREKLNIPHTQCVVLYSGSMGRKQGLEVVIAAAALSQKTPNVVFVLCGDGPARSELESRASKLPNVRFLEIQPAAALNELLNLADIHVLPQKADAADLVMPSKLLGMFASGRPTIATALPGTQLYETVSERGIVVPPEDPGAMADAVRTLSSDSTKRQELGTLAREFAVSNWGKEKILRQFEVKLREIADAGRKAES